MKLYAPNYYGDFKCIADRCRHSCCKEGWDIDIDEDALKMYESVGGELGERLKNGIEMLPEPHFKAGEDGSCPFLSAGGLCELILELGDGALCQICADHPRYRSFFADRVEIGIGLCCEEAARLILSKEEKTEIVLLSDDGISEAEDKTEQGFLALRNNIFSLLQDRSISVFERLDEVFLSCGTEFAVPSMEIFADRLEKTEILSRDWKRRLKNLKAPCKIAVPQELEKAFEQLAVYFVYRHFADGLYDGRLTARLKFAAAAVEIIAEMLIRSDRRDMGELIEIARLFSSEIEYSEENTELIFEICGD